MKPRSNCMPSTTSSVGFRGLGFLDRDHAFAADLLHGVGDELADRRIVVSGDGGDLRLFLARLRPGATVRCSASIADFVAPIQAALEVDRAGAGDDVAHAVGKDRVREDGRRCWCRRRRASPVFSAACRSICAPRFSSGSLRSNSLAMVTPSLQTIGAPHFFSIRTDFDLGPSVTRTASASCVAPRRIFSTGRRTKQDLFMRHLTIPSCGKYQPFASQEIRLGKIDIDQDQIQPRRPQRKETACCDVATNVISVV